MAILINSLTVPGNAIDLKPGSGANINRLGGFVSDLFYDRTNNVYYGLVDRGPGGGVISYETRVEKFSLNVDPITGAISNFNLLQTIPFTVPAGITLNGVTSSTTTPFNGLNPLLLNGNKSVLGLSQDAEGFAVAPNGNFYVSDEYGPSVYEFSPTGSFIRAFTTPSNLIPREASTLNYVDGRPTITTGRQDNRGFEGVTISPDGSKLYALLQDPLVNEGSSNDGRRSRNLRLVEFNTATGLSTAQYIYQVEDIIDINARIPGTANDFSATNQGRSIGISSITALNDNEFIVIERDNRGFGVDDPTAANPVGSKRLYKISLTGATDVSGTSLANTNTLPGGVTPVSKTLFQDLQASIVAAGQKIPEKIEGFTVGPKLNDGTYALIVGTDNDFSVTQSGGGTQFDVVTNGVTSQQIAIDSAPPSGFSLIPSFLFSFKTGSGELTFTPQITPAPLPTPTPTTLVPSGGGNLILGTNSLDVINGSSSNDTIYGYAGNDSINAVGGNDYVDGGIGNDLLTGGSGNDTLLGGAGNDTLIGVSTTSFVTPGLNEIDNLFGGAIADTFVLGDRINVFYNDNSPVSPGLSDYAVIRDFSTSEDFIRLKNGLSYVVGLSPIASLSGAAIFVNDGSSPELIAVLPGLTPSSAINSRFVFA